VLLHSILHHQGKRETSASTLEVAGSVKALVVIYLICDATSHKAVIQTFICDNFLDPGH
jgi:hypothetical protein